MGAGILLRCLVLVLLGALVPTAPAAQEGLDVVNMVLAEPVLDTGAEQLVQVSLRNLSNRPLRAGLQLDVLTKESRPAGIRLRRIVEVRPGARVREFFRLKAPRRPGEYAARLVVLTPDYKRALIPGAPKFLAAFKVTGVAPPEEGEGGAGGDKNARGAGKAPSGKKRKTFTTKPGLEFEKPDLIWEGFTVGPSSILMGESIKIKAELRNIGGDIARDIEVKTTYFNTRLPKRVLPLSTSAVDVLAPGEKIELEFDFRFPADALLGDYQIAMLADSTNKVAEADEKNNRAVTELPVRLSTILLIFPERGFQFDQAGLFLFRWSSTKYDEFKVQVGTDARFENSADFFDLPQGEKWTQDQEIVPLAGELPGMLLGLMVKNNAQTAHWRVVGRVAGTDKVGFSLARRFTLDAQLRDGTLESQSQEQQQGEPAPGADQQQGAGGGSSTQTQGGGGQPPAQPPQGRSGGALPPPPPPPGR